MTNPRLHSRTLVRISPMAESESAADFLQGLVTNDVTGPFPVYAALLSAQGKHLFDFLVWADGADLLLDCEAAVADDLVKRLSLYRLRKQLAIVRDDALGVFWSDSGPSPAERHQIVDSGPWGSACAPDPRLPALGQRWIAPASPNDASADATWLAHRLSLGVPEGRAELGDLLWLETNAADLNGVSFTKGCYIGQENTARMNWRQKVNRRLLVVPLAASDPARQVAAWPELGLALDHLRVADISSEFVPPWMQLGEDD